jgi:hypothetical protein
VTLIKLAVKIIECAFFCLIDLGTGWKRASKSKGDEVWLVVRLKVWEVPSVEVSMLHLQG